MSASICSTSSKTNICERVFSGTKNRVNRLDTKGNVRGDEEKKSKMLISFRNNRGGWIEK